jgi:predicted aminopeptidase
MPAFLNGERADLFTFWKNSPKLRKIVRNTLIVIIALIGLMLIIPGCQAGYIVSQGLGQMHMVMNQVHTGRVLEDDSEDPEVRRKIQLCLDARQWAVDNIGADPDSENYLWYYDHGTQPIIWAVVGSRKDALEPYTWWFPIVGTLPYKGYFRKEAAEAEGNRLKQEGYDVSVGGRVAYSTLGWFTDPILSGFLELPDQWIVDTVLHEMTHTAVYINDHTSFNESLASFVGERACQEFYADIHPEKVAFLSEIQAVYRDRRQFMVFINDLRSRLEKLYATEAETAGTDVDLRAWKIEQRELLFADAKRRFKDLKLETERYNWFADRPLDNTFILSMTRYLGEFEAFDRALDAHNGDFRAFLEEMANLNREDPMEALKAKYPPN